MERMLRCPCQMLHWIVNCRDCFARATECVAKCGQECRITPPAYWLLLRLKREDGWACGMSCRNGPGGEDLLFTRTALLAGSDQSEAMQPCTLPSCSGQSRSLWKALFILVFVFSPLLEQPFLFDKAVCMSHIFGNPPPWTFSFSLCCGLFAPLI